MTEWQVYWWLKLSGIQTFFLSIGIGCGIVGASCLKVGCSSFGIYEWSNKSLKMGFVWIVISILPFAVSVLIPNTRQYAMITVFPKIVNSEIAQDIPDDMKDMYGMVKEYMKEILKPETSE